MKLNPAKCVFGVTAGKFLGFMVNQRGIEANPEKIRALLEMHSPKSTKDVQRLTGRVAALNRFVSRATDKCLPFFKVLRKAFEWTPECEEAFHQLKAYLGSPPLLSRPLTGETLYIYLAVSASAVSSALIREEGGVQKPVYYVSKAYQGAESRYPMLEKLALALITSARRLKPYFQAHSIIVPTDQPLRQVLFKPEKSGRLMAWAVELGEFDIEYRPRTAIKGQALADFIVEFTSTEEESMILAQPQSQVSITPTPDASFLPSGSTTSQKGMTLSGEAIQIHFDPTLPVWVLHVDGSSNSTGSGAGLILTSPDQMGVEYALRFNFKASNNEAEYEALIAGLRLAKSMGAQQLRAFSDSKLIVNQVRGEYEARDEKMAAYLRQVKRIGSQFKSWVLTQIPRAENAHADSLARLASAPSSELKRTIPVEMLMEPSITVAEEVMELNLSPCWMDPIVKYIKEGELPPGKNEAKKMRYRAAQYAVIDDVLYKRGYLLPYLRCLHPDEADYVMREIHEGICGSHVGGRALARRALSEGYYWPTMREDTKAFVKKCDKCQRHANIDRRPSEDLTSITVPWPFSQWGLDLAGPFPTGKSNYKYIIVAVDYFTKWVEAEPLTAMTEQKCQDFVMRNICCRFGIPKAFVSDHGTQFDCAPFKEYCSQLGIKNYYASVAHPQANGQTEVTNRTIKQGLRKKLEDAKGLWVEELPHILWAYRTTARTPTGETPFSLAFGTEAVVPTEIGLPTFRIAHHQDELNEEELRVNLDLLEEKRERAQIKMAAYQQRAARYHNKRVKHKQFREGTMVQK